MPLLLLSSLKCPGGQERHVGLRWDYDAIIVDDNTITAVQVVPGLVDRWRELVFELW